MFRKTQASFISFYFGTFTISCTTGSTRSISDGHRCFVCGYWHVQDRGELTVNVDYSRESVLTRKIELVSLMGQTSQIGGAGGRPPLKNVIRMLR